ncbi:RpiR family transcriptional regulator, partial [Streptomyces anulatus]
ACHVFDRPGMVALAFAGSAVAAAAVVGRRAKGQADQEREES